MNNTTQDDSDAGEEAQDDSQADEEDQDPNPDLRPQQANIENITNPKQFPTSAIDTYWTKDYLGNNAEVKIIGTFDETCPFPDFPTLKIKADVDSLYTIHDDLHSLIDCFNDKSVVQLITKNNPLNKMWGSRFYVDASQLPNPPETSIGSAKKVSLNMFPSIKIGTIAIGHHREMDMFMVHTATPVILKNHVFTKTQIATINAAINGARLLSSLECEADPDLDVYTSTFTDMNRTKSYYGKNSEKLAPNRSNVLPNKQIKIFAKNLTEAIKSIAEGDGQFNFEHDDFTGIVSDVSFKPIRKEMRDFAKELVKGAMFVGTISGMKGYYNKEEFMSTTEMPEDWMQSFQDTYEAHKQEIIDQGNHLLAKDNGFETTDELPEGFVLYGDGQNGTDKIELDEIGSDYPCYKDLFYDPWKEKIHNVVSEKVATLTANLHQDLVQLLGIKEREKEVFFDIGVEIRGVGNNSMLLNIDQLHPLFVALSKQAR